ncbi:MAG TPA: branched-chain amino acid ABC transporter permease [Anaerolineales bacterium]
MIRKIDLRWIAAILVIALLAGVPIYLRASPYQMSVVTGAFFYVILASSWALLAGIAGQFSFAHMAFVGIGAYTTGLLGSNFGTTPLQGIIAGTLLAGVVGFVIGVLCLRLRAAYLALFTIAFSEIFRIILLTEFRITGGSNGLQLDKLWSEISGTQEYYIMLILLVGGMGLMYWLANSRFGMFVRAMREDQEAAAAMGVDVVRYKVMIFVITSLIVGLAGAVFYHQVGIITPNIMELLQMSLVISMAVIGGMESLVGAGIGAFVSRVTLELLREINIFGYQIELGAWRFAVFGIILMLTLRFWRNGLIPPLINRLYRQPQLSETVAKRKASALDEQ